MKDKFLDQHMKRTTSRKIINKIIKDVRGMNVEKEMQKTKSGKNWDFLEWEMEEGRGKIFFRSWFSNGEHEGVCLRTLNKWKGTERSR